MNHTTIQFPSIKQLFEFRRAANVREFQFDTSDCTMRAELSEDQLWEARTHFQGKVIEHAK